MKHIIVILLLVLVAVAGCIAPVDSPEEESSFKEVDSSLEDALQEGLQDVEVEETSTVEPEEPEESKVPEVAEESEVAEDPSVNEFYTGEKQRMLETESVFVTEIVCKEEEQTLTFNLHNPLEQPMGLIPVPVLQVSELEPFTLTVNGRIVRNLNEWCGQDELAPESMVSCTTPFISNAVHEGIMVRVGEDSFFKPLTNYIRGKTNPIKAQAEFVCE